MNAYTNNKNFIFVTELHRISHRQAYCIVQRDCVKNLPCGIPQNVKVTFEMVEMMMSMIKIDTQQRLQAIANAINNEYDAEIAACMIC